MNVTISWELFRQMRTALAVADSVLQKHRFAGTDQNPKGVTDLVGSALLAADRITQLRCVNKDEGCIKKSECSHRGECLYGEIEF
jgi:hypothetical protein